MEEVVLSAQTQRSKRLKVASHVARSIVGLVFIFSGFVKAVDPWGTMIKVNEYLTIYRMDWFAPLSAPFSIWLSSAELMMGMMLTFKVRIRMVSTFAIISMFFFTVLAFLSATIFPVESCGCFGEAIRLKPWATFAKNMVLLPLIGVVWYRYKPDRIFAFNKLEIFLMLLFFTSTVSLATYCFFHLPLMDFRPYKIGVNMPEAIAEARISSQPKSTTTLLYRNLSTGRVKEFSLDDTQWQDETKWEWVDTITKVDDVADYKDLIAEFSIFNHLGEDRTDWLLSQQGGVVMICVTTAKDLKTKVEEELSRYINRKERDGYRVVVLSPEVINGGVLKIANHEIDLNNIHALVEIDPPRAQKTIIELSGLMDYLLYESSNIERVSLQRELEFTESYINLMRLRYPKRVVIDFSYSEPVPLIKLPPLLFLNFIENTFKYGVDYTKESFINVRFDFTDSELTMVTQNSNHADTVKSKQTRGIGISNSRKRLKLLYGNSYILDINDSEDIYSVTLKIPTL